MKGLLTRRRTHILSELVTCKNVIMMHTITFFRYCTVTPTRVCHITVVSRQTLTDAQGLISCNIRPGAVRVWVTDTAKFVHVSSRVGWVTIGWHVRGWVETWTNFAVSVAQTPTIRALILQAIRPCSSVRVWLCETTDFMHPSHS